MRVATMVAVSPLQPGATGLRGFGRRWFFLVVLGETAGFVVPGLAWYTVWTAGLPPPGAAAIVVLAGAGEGAVLGTAQWMALRSWDCRFSKHWIPYTSAGAAVAWACGMAPSTASDLGAPLWAAVALGITLSPVLLFSLPVAQWVVLRRHVSRAWRWIAWSTAAWAVALPPTFVAPALLPSDASDAQVAAMWLMAGLTMAAILAAFTGFAMARILANEPEAARAPG